MRYPVFILYLCIGLMNYILVEPSFSQDSYSDIVNLYQIIQTYSWDTLTDSQIAELQQQAIRLLPSITDSFKLEQGNRLRLFPGVLANYSTPTLPGKEIIITILYNPKGLDQIGSSERVKAGSWTEISNFWTPTPQPYDKDNNDDRVIYSFFWQQENWYCQIGVIGSLERTPQIIANQIAYDLFISIFNNMNLDMEKIDTPVTPGPEITRYERWKMSAIDRKARDASNRAISNEQAKIILDSMNKHNVNKKAYESNQITFAQFDAEEKRIEMERTQKILDSFNIGKQVYSDTYQRLLSNSGLVIAPTP